MADQAKTILFLVFLLASSLGLFMWAVLAYWWIYPRFKDKPKRDAPATVIPFVLVTQILLAT